MTFNRNTLFNLIVLSCISRLSYSHDLNVVTALQSQLKSQPTVVIFGAPGSGKTEQMELALAGKPYQVFDLRNSFIKYYTDQQGITDTKKRDDVKKKEYLTLKAAERAWLLKEKDTIANDLASNGTDLIVFDEFDLWQDRNPNKDELETINALLKIAQHVSKNKKIIFIIHAAGLNSKALQQELATKFNITASNIIRTGYFTPDEELSLLKHTALNDDEQNKYMEWAQGDPSAYLEIIENLSKKEEKKYTFDELTQEAQKTVDKVYRVIKMTESDIAQNLHDIAVGQQTLESYENKDIIHRLLATGLIGMRNGKYIMPKLVKEGISK